MKAIAPSTPGAYTLTAKATDAGGQGPASSGVTFIVPSAGSTVQKRWGQIKR